MNSPNRRWLSGLAAAVALLPTSVGGQTVTQSFDEVQRVPRVDRVAVITGETGRAPLAPAAVRAEAGAGNQADEWQRVDALKPGTRIVVTLKTGEKRIGDFRRATAEEVTIAVGQKRESWEQLREETLSKSLIATVATYDPVKDGIQRGVLAGAGGLLAFIQMGNNSCGTGCENDMPGAAILLVGALGAGAGSLVGFLADRDAGRPELLFPPSASSGQSRPLRTSRFFPARPSVRVGPVYSQTSIRSSLVEGSAAAPGFALAVQFSPHISVHAEYTATNGRFYAPAGSIPDSILQNLVPTSDGPAGRSRGIESRKISYAFSELVGVHPSPWGRVRVELVGGLGVQGEENRIYFDAYQKTGQGTMSDPTRYERMPGKYYVLNFETPEAGLVLGLDAEIAVVRGLAVVPTVRYNRMGDAGPSIAYGVGAHWRF